MSNCRCWVKLFKFSDVLFLSSTLDQGLVPPALAQETKTKKTMRKIKEHLTSKSRLATNNEVQIDLTILDDVVWLSAFDLKVYHPTLIFLPKSVEQEREIQQFHGYIVVFSAASEASLKVASQNIEKILQFSKMAHVRSAMFRLLIFSLPLTILRMMMIR